MNQDPEDAVVNDVGKRFADYNAELERLHGPVIRALQATLDGLVGRDFGSLEANQAVARDIQALMNRLGLRVACPRDGCGEPSALRCRRAGGVRHGCFQFEHSLNGRITNHSASTTFPRLRLIPAAPDRRRKKCPCPETSR